MNIETKSNITTTAVNTATSSGKAQVKENNGFAEELNNLSETNREEKTEEKKSVEETNETEGAKDSEDTKVVEKEEQTALSEDKKETETNTEEKLDEDKDSSKDDDGKNNESEKNINDVMNGLQNAVEEINKLNHTDDKSKFPVKPNNQLTDNEEKDKDNSLINNDMNIQEPKDPFNQQMNANMNFNSNNGQPFNAYVMQQQELAINEKDLAEEKDILSTMSENIAIANKNMLLQQQNTQEQVTEVEPQRVKQNIKTVQNESGVKKVDTKSNITVETVVKFDSVIMDKSDVDFFVNLVENGNANLTTHQALKSSQVSKTLADLIAKSMKDNQPVRIDFDNNISVIIKIGREGKISADFLPSSQVAEAYLKENLPLLRQRFDDNNIEYDELNERRQRQDDNKENRRKDRKDE